MAFTLNLKSVDGYFTGYCKGAAPLENAHNNIAPSYSDTQFPVFQFQDDGVQESLAAWARAYSPASNQWGTLDNAYDFWDYVQGYQAQTGNTEMVVCAFDIVDNLGHETGTQICLMASTNSSGNISWYLKKRVYSQGAYVYTSISNVYTENYSGIVSFGMVAGIITISNVQYYSFGFAAHMNNGYRAQATLFGNTSRGVTEIMGGSIPETESDPDLGPASEPGGYGPGGGGSGGPGPTFDGTSDPWVDYAVKPGIASLGLVNLYKCDVGSLVNLGAELFPDIHWPTSLQDVGEVLAAVSDSIWNSKLIDYIISAHIIPVDVTGGNLTAIKVGTRTMQGIMARPITDDVVEFNCGTVHIDEYYTNFADYLTRCRIYIPFHGFVEIKPEYWQSADLTLKYRFNVIDGSFIAMLYSTITRHQKPFTSLIGQYTGCSCVHVPMTGASYASMFGGMISGAAGMAAGLATSNPALAATSAMNTVASSGGSMQMSNPYNASAGFYGHPCPYLIIERPISHFSENYAKEEGIPLLVTKRIGACSGYTVAENIILDGIPCTDAEKEKIRTFFKSGVIIK